MNKDQKSKLVKYGLPVGALVLAFTAPATTIGAVIGGALGFGGGILYNEKKSNGGSGGVTLAAATAIGIAVGGVAGLTSDFNSANAAPVTDNIITMDGQSASVTTLESIMDGGIKDAQNNPVYLKLAA